MIQIKNKNYRNFEEFREDLLYNGYMKDSSTTERFINHEKAHFQCALKKGYESSFHFTTIILNLFNFGLRVNVPRVKLKGFVIPRDLAEISLAPKDPSFLDKFYASRSFQFFYNSYYNLSKKNN